nr:MAG TPA: DNA packaging protein gp3 [Caudoviricetes sp.]
MKFYNENIDQQKLKEEYLTAYSRCKYKTAEELVNVITDYFKQCDKKNKPYTMSGLALYMGLTTQTLRNYEKEYPGTEYSDIIKMAKQTIETYTAEATFDNRKFQGAKFNLQNNFGWSDKQDTNLSGQVTEIVKLEDVL